MSSNQDTGAAPKDSLRPAGAADGDLDTTFSSNGKLTVTWGDVADGRAVSVLGDGSVVVAVERNWPSSEMGVLKLTPAGVPDGSFGSSGKVEIPIMVGGQARSAAPIGIHALEDGKIVVAGQATSSDLVLVRLDASGNRDLAFGPNGTKVLASTPPGGGTPWMGRFERAGDGYILGGRCVSCAAGVVALRVTSAGEPVPGFGTDGWAIFDVEPGAGHLVDDVAVDAQGRVLMTGIVQAADSLPFVLRLTSGGVFDSTFGGGVVSVDWGAEYNRPRAVVDDPVSGNIYVAVRSRTAERTSGVAALSASGSVRTTFGVGGIADLTLEYGTEIVDLAVQSDGKIIGAGFILHNNVLRGDFFLARLLPSGERDSTFDGNGVVRYPFDLVFDGDDEARALALVGGKLVAVGRAQAADNESRVAVLRTQSSLIFADGLERGSTAAW